MISLFSRRIINGMGLQQTSQFQYNFDVSGRNPQVLKSLPNPETSGDTEKNRLPFQELKINIEQFSTQLQYKKFGQFCFVFGLIST